MHKRIVLLRGINVGGHNKLPMAELKSLLQTVGCTDVTTYIASGNVVLQSAEASTSVLAAEIGALIEEKYGFKPDVLVLRAQELASIVEANPYPQAAAEPKSLHAFFLSAKPASTAQEALSGMATERESVTVAESCVYLHAPEGIGRSKLAAGVEKAVGVSATGRNWRTVQKLLEMSAG